MKFFVVAFYACLITIIHANTLTSETSNSTPVAACRVKSGTPCASDVEIQPGTEGSVSLECRDATYDVCGWVSRSNQNCDDVPICAPVVTACRVESGTPCASDVEIQPGTEGSVSLECADATYDVCGWVSRSNQNCDDVPICAPVVTACRVESGTPCASDVEIQPGTEGSVSLECGDTTYDVCGWVSRNNQNCADVPVCAPVVTACRVELGTSCASDVEIQPGVEPVSLECGDATYEVCGWVSRSNQNCDDVPVCTSTREDVEDVVAQNNGADNHSMAYQPSIIICIAALLARQFL